MRHLEPCFNYRPTLGHNYFGECVAHVLRRFLNDSDPISFFAQVFFSSQILTLVKI